MQSNRFQSSSIAVANKTDGDSTVRSADPSTSVERTSENGSVSSPSAAADIYYDLPDLIPADSFTDNDIDDSSYFGADESTLFGEYEEGELNGILGDMTLENVNDMHDSNDGLDSDGVDEVCGLLFGRQSIL